MKNWKTTLLGAIIAVAMFLSSNENPTLQSIGKIVSIVGTALFGFNAKDNNVTGGTRNKSID